MTVKDLDSELVLFSRYYVDVLYTSVHCDGYVEEDSFSELFVVGELKKNPYFDCTVSSIRVVNDQLHISVKYFDYPNCKNCENYDTNKFGGYCMVDGFTAYHE